MAGRSRIVFVLPVISGGGAERVSLVLLKGVSLPSVEVHLVVFKGEGVATAGIPPDVIVHVLDRSQLRFALISLVRLLRRLRPVVVYSSLGYVNVPLLFMRLLFGSRVRLLLREANTPSSSLAAQRFTGFFRWAYRILYPKADAIICQSRLMRCELVRDYGVPRRRLHLLYNPTDVEALRQGRQPCREPGSGLRFVAAGAFHYKKGFDRLLEWFAQMPPDAHLTLFGCGPMEEQLRRRALELEIAARVRMPGFEPQPWNWFAGADAFLLPSRWEGMPNVVLEALACGTPVIAMREAGGVIDVARMASREDLVLCSTGEEFVAAMRLVKPSGTGLKLGPSRIPDQFALDLGLCRFNTILARLLAN